MSDVSWSPDGSKLAYILIREGGDVFTGGLVASVHVINADGSSPRRLISYPGARLLDWSPDGSLIAFSALEHIAKVGSRRNNVIRGTRADEVICGLGGDDVVIGGGGRDEIYGDNCRAVRGGGKAGVTSSGPATASETRSTVDRGATARWSTAATG